MRIVSEILFTWDKDDRLVGDVLILNRDLSCQFFLIVCRRLESELSKADGHIGHDSLILWEKLLFTWDFHDKHYNLKGVREDFPGLFASCGTKQEQISSVIKGYLENGFRSDHTTGLQSIVLAYMNEIKPRILSDAFSWWWLKGKMTYAVYKYEASRGANIREVIKGTSVEHILPQGWKWEWVKKEEDDLKEMSGDEQDSFRKKIDGCINGVGNLLLITPGENSSVGNGHPAEKPYEKYRGGSYQWHDKNREKWKSSKEWSKLINERGEWIFEFMLTNLVDSPESLQKP